MTELYLARNVDSRMYKSRVHSNIKYKGRCQPANLMGIGWSINDDAAQTKQKIYKLKR